MHALRRLRSAGIPDTDVLEELELDALTAEVEAKSEFQNIEPVSAISNRVSAEEIWILKIRAWRLAA